MKPSFCANMKKKSIQEEARKKDRKRLLVEPTAAEEQEALKSSRSMSFQGQVTKQQSELTSRQHSVRKSSHKKQLSSLLAILFGVVFLVLVCHGSLVVSQIDNSTTVLADANLLLDTSTTEPPTTATNTATTTTAAITEEATTSEPPEVEEDDDDSEPAKTEQPISKLLDSVGGEAADLLVNYVKKDPEEEDLEAELRAAAGNSSEQQLRYAMETYARWRATGDDVIELFSRKILPTLIEHGYEVDTSTIGGLLQVFNGLRSLKPWAMKLLDASAKISPGILVGTQADFGDYDECLSVRADDPSGLATPDQEVSIDPATGLPTSTLVGRYCVADVEFPKPPRKRLPERNKELDTDFAPIELRGPLFNFSESPAYKDTIFVETANFFHMLYVDPLRVGICLTNKIDPANFELLFNKVFEYFRVKISFQGRCVTKYDKPVWSLEQRVSAWALLIACALVLLSTALDLLHLKLNKLPGPPGENWIKYRERLSSSPSLNRYRALFTSFSLLRNTQRLFRAQQLPAAAAAVAPASHKWSEPSIGAVYSSSSDSSESSPATKRRLSSLAGSDLNLINGAHRKLGPLQPQFLQAPATDTEAADLGAECKGTTAKTTQEPAAASNLACLHGVRVITMVWMIINHTYLFGGFFVLWAYRRLIDISEWPKSLSFQLVLNGWLTVETYFLLSALIIVLNVLPLMRARKFSYPAYILHRLIRLLPAYAGLVCLNFLWPLISSGPVWMVKGRSFIQTPCENYLWTNFLFINNWIWPEKQCMVHTWFLSADFQLYLVAPVIVYFLYRRPVFGHLLNIIVALLASVVSGLVIYANKLMPSTLINRLEFDSIKQQLSYSYFATYQHMGPYCLGIFIGYLLHNRPQVRLPKHLTWLLWLLLPPLSFTTLLLTYLWNGAYNEPSLINPSPLVSAVYVAIHRTIWTALVAWTVFACSTGRASLLASFLSHPMFVPLSRLSFSIYLVHMPIIMFRALNLRHTIEWTDTNIIIDALTLRRPAAINCRRQLWEACGNFIFSVIVGYFVNIAFESPIINLEQFVFGRRPATDVTHQAARSTYPDKFVPLKEDPALRRSNGSRADQVSGSKASGSENDSDDSKSSLRFATESGKGTSSDASDEQVTTRTTASSSSDSSQVSHAGPTRTRQVSARWARETDQLRSQLMDYRRTYDPEVAPGSELYEEERAGQEAPPVGDQTSPQDRYSDYFLGPQPPVNLQLVHNDPMVDTEHGAGRPSRYVTLTRNNRSTTNPSANNELDELYSTRSSRTRSLVGADSQQASGMQSDGPLPEGALISRKRIGMAHRQRRYNTLTGAGSKEWRRQVAQGEDNWRRANLRPSANEFLGAMIPRIDSSTLKRQQAVAPRPAAAASIAEEPVFEE